MSDPYAPPSTREDAVEAISFPFSNKDVLLRRIGALAIAYVLTSTLWMHYPDFQNMLIGAVIMALYLYGFLRGGRRSHFWIAFFMVLTIAVQAFFMNRALAHPERLMMDPGPHPWLDFVAGLTPFIIAFACAAALYFRARARRV